MPTGGRTSIDDDTRALLRAARAMTDQVDRLRRRLDRDGVLLTPTQYDRIGAALAQVGLIGAVLLGDDLARTQDAEDAAAEALRPARPRRTNGGD
jgi:hypothetical protein